MSVGAGDAAVTSWGSSDDVASKMTGGGSYWVPASFVGAGGVVWVLVSKLGGSGACGDSKPSVWMPDSW